MYNICVHKENGDNEPYFANFCWTLGIKSSQRYNLRLNKEYNLKIFSIEETKAWLPIVPLSLVFFIMESKKK